jgi:ketosteroid isomerase-like protein
VLVDEPGRRTIELTKLGELLGLDGQVLRGSRAPSPVEGRACHEVRVACGSNARLAAGGTCPHHLREVNGRPQLIQDAFAALASGDLGPFKKLFAPDAKWIGIPGAAGEGGKAYECESRSQIVGRLEQHHKNGRRFTLGELIEQGDRVAVGFTINNPDWSRPVNTFKVFTFRPGENVVVRMNDCIDESYALQVLAA